MFAYPWAINSFLWWAKGAVQALRGARRGPPMPRGVDVLDHWFKNGPDVLPPRDTLSAIWCRNWIEIEAIDDRAEITWQALKANTKTFRLEEYVPQGSQPIAGQCIVYAPSNNETGLGPKVMWSNHPDEKLALWGCDGRVKEFKNKWAGSYNQGLILKGFYSAWLPPLLWSEALARQHPGLRVQHTYHEPIQEFGGWRTVWIDADGKLQVKSFVMDLVDYGPWDPKDLYEDIPGL